MGEGPGFGAVGGSAASTRILGSDGARRFPHLYRRLGKRALDLAVAGAMLVVLAPLIVVLAALVASEGGAPFFTHVRIGRGGRPFACYKIRSMVPDAEERLKAILVADAVAAAEWERGRKLRRDPRVTRFGHILRTTSLDELPQFWNVLRGEMSLVGPRPITASELARYGEHAEVYLALRPGLTGPWQVKGRNEASYAERVRLDAEYGRSLSLRRDVGIIFMTALVVLRATGR